MTRLPVDSWDVQPRLDIPPYELNAICPITGETAGLEDHHIFRKSFTALGAIDNDRLYWVSYISDPDDPWPFLVRNRVALSSDAHARITTNRARLEYRGTDLWYIEGEEERKLDLNLRLMEGSEKVSQRRQRAVTTEELRSRPTYTIRPPKGEPNMLPELEQQAREKLAKQLDIEPTKKNIPAYKLTTAVFYHYISS